MDLLRLTGSGTEGSNDLGTADGHRLSSPPRLSHSEGDGLPDRVPSSPFPGADLELVLKGALTRCGKLLSSGEIIVIQGILSLNPAALELYARLSLRRGGLFRKHSLRYDIDIDTATSELEIAGLIYTHIPDHLSTDIFSIEELKNACRRLGLSPRGNRENLCQTLKNHQWVDEPLILLRHRELLRKMELLFFQRAWMDRSALVKDRLGVVQFPHYHPTDGPGLFEDRRALACYERGRKGAWEPEEARRIALKGPALGRPWEAAVEAVLNTEGEHPELLAALVKVGAPLRARLALALERQGDLKGAFAICAAGSPHAAEAIALRRSGQRIGKKIGKGIPPVFTPDIPTRSLQMKAASPTHRPRWQVGQAELTVEQAVIALLAEAGVEAIHTENRLWTSLFTIVFWDCYWLPVPNMLPGPFLPGPLDLGSPHFYTARRAEADQRLAQLRQKGFVSFLTTQQKETMETLGAPELAFQLGPRLPGSLIADVLERLLQEGWSAAQGLPDLLIFANGQRVPGLIPPQLPTAPLLAEVKGPSDALQDGQRVWIHHILKSKNNVEVWWVST